MGNDWDPKLYDAKHNFVTKYGGDLLALLAAQPGERILDAGCGTGHLTNEIAQLGAVVVGMDSSGQMLEQARAAYPGLTFVEGSVTDFDVEEKFDAVFSNAVLHWVKEAERAVRCFRDALRPGGRLVVEFGGKGNVGAITREVTMAIEDVTGRWQGHEWYFPSVSEYGVLLEAGGFEVSAAWLFDRFTPLEGEDGIKNWIRMFSGGMLKGLTDGEVDAVVELAEKQLRPVLYRDGVWHADYRRLRVQGVRKP